MQIVGKVCFLFLLLGFQALFAQKSIKFDRITTEDGLPQEHVYAVLEDQKGFLWLGMESGLARFDGYTFKTYVHDAEDTTSLGGNIVRAIFEDKDGFIWVGTDGGGLSRYDPAMNRFVTFTHRPDNPNSLSSNRVYAIAADRDGHLWVATLGGGLNRLAGGRPTPTDRGLAARFTHFKKRTTDPASLADNNVWTLLVDRNNQLWAGTVAAGLELLDLNKTSDEQATFQHFPYREENSRSLSGNSVKSIYEDADGTIWVGTEFNGLNRFEPTTQAFRSWQYEERDNQSISNNHVSCILEDDRGGFWVGTNGGGVNKFDREQGTFTRYEYVPSDPFSLHGNLVSTLHQGKSGILWLGMVNKGLNRIDPRKQIINHFYPVTEKPGSLSGNLVKSVYEDHAGEIWVGTYGSGLNHFDPETGTFTNYLQPTQGGHIAKNNIQCIYEDRSRRLWIGTDGGGLFSFDRTTKRFTDFNQLANGDKLSGQAVWAIQEDLKGNLWVGTADGGLNRLDARRQRIDHFRHVADDPTTINSNDVRVVFEDHLGVLWVGTYGGGLNRYQSADETFDHYPPDPQNATSLSNGIVTDIFESPATQRLWIGTYGGGLNRFDRTTGTFTVYREQDGLANDVVKSIEEDREGHLWISTLKGISKFDPQTTSFASYTSSDGLQGDGFNLGASCFTTSGVMYFGGTNGMNAFSPEKIEARPNETFACHLTDLKIFNRSIRPGEAIRERVILNKSINDLAAITIPYFIDDFTIEFAALDFAASDQLRYAYRLEGISEDWNYTDSDRRYASYSNLSPGDYTFRVRASNAAGVWNTATKELMITILPAPWKTVWAYLGYALLFLLAVYLYRRYTLASYKLKSELKLERLDRQKTKELNEMKLQFFTNISHEIRTPLTLIVSPIQELIATGEVRKEVRDQLRNINRNANRLLLLVNQLLEFRQQEAGHSGLSVRKADLVHFVREIVLSFKEFSDRRNIRLSVDTPPEGLLMWYDSDKMEKALFNLLSNAFKFTSNGGTVRVAVEPLDQEVRIVVEDSGSGIAPEDLPYIFDRFHKFDTTYQGTYLGSGIGLALTKKLVGLHHGTISAESEIGAFTRFTIELPTGSAHYQPEQLHCGNDEYEQPDYYQLDTVANDHLATGVPTRSESVAQLLIVEDNDDLRNYLKRLFAQDYRILEAANGKAALEIALAESPDLILSDIMMPEMDGIELCKRIKTALETSHIPVILLTARNSMFYQTEGLETGAEDYITKPFDPKLLQLRVKNLITARKRLREKFGRLLSLEPQEVALTSPDQELLQRALDAVEKHMDNPSFDVSILAREVGVSRPVLYRKLPALTDQTPNEFIRIIRLKRAAQILDQADLPIAELCYQTGFKTPKYFSKCFRDFFGILPSEYAKEKKREREGT